MASGGKFDDGLQTEQSSGGVLNFLEDDPRDMTFGRRLALSLMKKYKWYNPRLEDSIDESPEVQNNNIDEGLETEEDRERESIRKGSFRSAWGHPVSETVLERPSLEKAWAFFEHVSLPRYLHEKEKGGRNKSRLRRIINKFRKGNKTMEKAEPGEQRLRTKLYDPIFTPHKQLGDFGLGVGLYFTSLRGIMVLSFLAGIMNIPNLMFYNKEYNNGAPDVDNAMLKGAAICTSYAWVPCYDCFPSRHFSGDRFRWLNESTKTECLFPQWCEGSESQHDFGTEAGGFALKTNCAGASLEAGLINLFTLSLIGLGLGVVAIGSRKLEVQFDEDEQTAQDYSIIIQEPPQDARDPTEWKTFFETNFNAYVTCCTIAIDNDDVVRQLFTRRESLKKIEMLVEPGTGMDMITLAKVSAIIQNQRSTLQRWLAMISPGIPEHYKRVAAITATIRGWVQLSYPVTNVFITFETEAAQREVLSAMSVGRIHVKNNNTSAVDPKCLFRGKHVLAVREADEPDSIRWQDLNEPLFNRLKQQAATTCITIAAIACVANIVIVLNDQVGTTFAAYFISIMNTFFPAFATMLTNAEAHGSEGGRQQSLYWKITLFRWLNTAVVFSIITPFTDIVSEHNSILDRVQSLFVSEISTSTLLQLADIGGHISRHYTAPRATTQDAMNLSMKGSGVEIAERYTNVTKILFLALWYSSIYPLGLFLCAIALFINYYVDKFSLTRTWARAPSVGNEVAVFSRKYFFPLTLALMAFMSSYFWAGFPYDNLCEKEMVGNSNFTQFIGTWVVPPQNNSEFMGDLPFKPVTKIVNVAPTDHIYEHCFQDLLRSKYRKFPFTSHAQRGDKIWMSSDQETVTDIFGIVSTIVIALIGLAFLVMIIKNIRSGWISDYSPRGEDQHINFSDVEVMAAYVPQVQSTVYPYPLLATSTTKFDADLMDWTDPERHCSFYDLTKDAKILVQGTTVKHKEVFSQIYHWPPSDPDKYPPDEPENSEEKSTRAEQPHHKEPHHREPHHKEPHHKELHHKETHHQEPHHKEPHHKEPHHKEPHHKEPHHKEAHDKPKESQKSSGSFEKSFFESETIPEIKSIKSADTYFDDYEQSGIKPVKSL